MDIEKITKTQLINKLIEQHQRIKRLEKRSEEEIDRIKSTLKEDDNKFESITDTNSIGILTIDDKGIITSCNDSILEFSGYSRNNLIGKYFSKKVSISTKDISRYMSIFKNILSGKEAEPFKIAQHHRDGQVRYGEVYFGPIKESNERISGFKIIIRDISNLKELEEQLKNSEEKFDVFLETSIDSIVLHDNGKIIKVNQSFMDLFSIDTKDLEGRSLVDFITEDYHDILEEKIEESYTGGFEIQGLKSSGSKVYIEVSGQDILYNNKLVRMEVLHDISDLRKAEKKIKYLKFHDSLTELYNRTYLEKVLGNVYRERHLPLNFIICDLNGLKLVNDTFGYTEGDKLLKRVAKILRYCSRKEDIVARWGGDEFFILLPRSTASEVEDVLYKIRNICASTKDQKIPLNMSMGISARTSLEQDFREVIKEAEDNMYTNKLLERKSIYNSIITSFERMLWEKSHETRDHAERLKGMIIKLGRAINLPQSKLDELVLLSTLHDIGKVAVPDSILMKKGKLNREEWKVIRRHPEIGYNIAKSTPQIAMVAEDILAHHEWWDGSGYPQSLKGDEIPVNSRITSIVDAYDVMTMGRPYKKPIPVIEAKAELKRCAGSQFSPILVDKFVRI
jgi:diguanylate cyclase (GGDEF)-like protein/PAS domain S-box-containing protein